MLSRCFYNCNTTLIQNHVEHIHHLNTSYIYMHLRQIVWGKQFEFINIYIYRCKFIGTYMNIVKTLWINCIWWWLQKSLHWINKTLLWKMKIEWHRSSYCVAIYGQHAFTFHRKWIIMFEFVKSTEYRKCIPIIIF